MTPQTCIKVARTIINDNDSSLYRQTTTELLDYFNKGLKEASRISPDHFKTTGDFTCTASNHEQALSYTDAQELVQVLGIKDGKRLFMMDLEAMNAFNPTWPSDAAGTPQNWAKHQGEKLRFYLYPKPSTMQVLEVSYIRNPATYTINQTVTEVPDSWETALAWYVIHMAEMKDDENATSGRALAAFQRFSGLIKG
jgi:hypothetical protein